MIKHLVFSLTLALTTLLWADDAAKGYWIDVRSIGEYQEEHLDGAVNIPFTEIKQRIAEVTTDKQATIHLYCTAGVRAQIAKLSLQSLGYENVINEGGLKDLKATTQ